MVGCRKDCKMKWHADEMTCWWNDSLENGSPLTNSLKKWHVDVIILDKMTLWWNDQLMKWAVD